MKPVSSQDSSDIVFFFRRRLALFFQSSGRSLRSSKTGSLRNVRIHPKNATANPESRQRRSRGSRRERRGFAPVFLREGDHQGVTSSRGFDQWA
ncbi:hypothetical protein BRARA_H00700 [Brassica rapa]|uniref:Uncharacterized protein n=1 Tax=Brassica campestris TaxID=3711 RepID=A0A397YAM6_BRACM|nr:hypothetical protein BRARA_H00700 [Brassica rapa]